MKRARRALTLVLLTPACVFADEVRTNGTMDLPAPTGVFLVGRESFHWIDKSRRENGSENKSDHRELMVHISYPAERTSRESVAPYFPNLELVKGKIGTAEYSILHSVHTHTLSGGKLSAARSQYPIVILSHGNQMNGFLYTAIIEDLASHGYVVAAIDHPYEALVTVFPDRRVVSYLDKLDPNPNSPSYQNDLLERIDNRAADIALVVTQLSKLNAGKESQFAGRLDLAHVGVVGHSRGGIAAAQACQIDQRLKACVNLDGRAGGAPFLPGANGKGPGQPFMYLAKPLRELAEEELAAQKSTRPQYERERAAAKKREDELMRTIKSGSYRVFIGGATHESFSDEPLLRWANEEEQKANQRRMQIVREYVRAFFDRHLKQEKAPRLDGPSVRYPEVTVERFGGAAR